MGLQRRTKCSVEFLLCLCILCSNLAEVNIAVYRRKSGSQYSICVEIMTTPSNCWPCAKIRKVMEDTMHCFLFFSSVSRQLLQGYLWRLQIFDQSTNIMLWYRLKIAFIMLTTDANLGLNLFSDTLTIQWRENITVFEIQPLLCFYTNVRGLVVWAFGSRSLYCEFDSQWYVVSFSKTFYFTVFPLHSTGNNECTCISKGQPWNIPCHIESLWELC